MCTRKRVFCGILLVLAAGCICTVPWLCSGSDGGEGCLGLPPPPAEATPFRVADMRGREVRTELRRLFARYPKIRVLEKPWVLNAGTIGAVPWYLRDDLDVTDPECGAVSYYSDPVDENRRIVLHMFSVVYQVQDGAVIRISQREIGPEDVQKPGQHLSDLVASLRELEMQAWESKCESQVFGSLGVMVFTEDGLRPYAAVTHILMKDRALIVQCSGFLSKSEAEAFTCRVVDLLAQIDDSDPRQDAR